MTYFSHNGTPEQAVAELYKRSHIDLCTGVVNDALNRLISQNDNNAENDTEKPVPYIGWYWRSINFFDQGDCSIAVTHDGYVGFCQNNKWDYEERTLTEAELLTFRNMIWEAYQLDHKGGQLSEIMKATRKAIKAAGDYIASLEVKP